MSSESTATRTPTAGARELKVHFVPKWPGNPYHAELAGHLADFGVKVQSEDRLKNIATSAAGSAKPDVVHIHAIPRFGIAPMAAMRFLMFFKRIKDLLDKGVAVVWTIHDISHHEAAFPKVELAFSRWLFRKADALIVHSEAARKAVERQWNVKCDDRLSIIPHGNYIGSYANHGDRDAARKTLKLDSGKLVILFLGIIRPYKGVLELIEAFKGNNVPDVELVIAGKPLSDELSAQIRSTIGGNTAIHFFPGRVEDDRIQDYFNAADLVVFPYTKALTSGALILAMSFGRACVAPKMGALEDTLDEDGGFLYDPAAPGALAAALKSASSSRERLGEMGRHNRRKAEGWPWSDTARMTAAAFRKCRNT